MQKDSTAKTILVAAVLCVICSILVAAAAVGLKPLQEANKKLDIQKNILQAAGLVDAKASKAQIIEAYKSIKAEVIELDSGNLMEDMKPEAFDQRKARKNPSMSEVIPADQDLGGIKTRSKYSTVYKVMESGSVKMLILPINGKGLWSTLYGFIALSPDLQTIKGLGFYEHGETPGLGGEVDNPAWKAQWSGKSAFSDDLEPMIQVIKGSVNPSDPQKQYKVDGLSGATITSNGVTGLVRYWLGADGFGPYLKKFQEQ